MSALGNISDLIPATSTASTDTAGTISGFPIAISIAIFLIFIVLALGWVVLTYVFGYPMKIASGLQGKALIQHFNTPKSGVFKVANVGGGAFRYSDVRDGTVGALPDSVHNVEGSQLIITYAQFGLSIPAKILGAISLLIPAGIMNLQDLKSKYISHHLVKDEDDNILYDVNKNPLETESINDDVILSGYDFDDFNKFMKESKEDKFIPLIIEAVPEFTDTNESADVNEKMLIVSTELHELDSKSGAMSGQLIICALILVILMVGFMLVK